MSEHDTVLVLAASYDDVADANTDFEIVKDLYKQSHSASHDFDAAVIVRDEVGNVDIVKKHEQPTRHGAAHGLGWGLAVGAACAILPGIALVGGLAAGGSVGAAVGAVTGHIKGGMDNEDLKEFGDVLTRGQAGLVLVYGTDMADEIAANIKATDKHISKEIDANTEELDRQIKAAVN
jgi:uncharacterized membrane protein